MARVRRFDSNLAFTIFFLHTLRNPLLVPTRETRLRAQKTYKLYIGGKFVRSESGRVSPALDSRNAVLKTSARRGIPGGCVTVRRHN